MTGGSGWWDAAFRAPYLAVYAHRDERSAEREAEFVARAVGPSPGARLLDAGCGAGRHTRALGALRFDVVGLDRSADLLAAAASRGGARYVRGDVRALPFRDAAFARVVSLFTSFGYFDERGDRAHLAEIARVLAPRGTFLLDFLNAPRVETTLVPESERHVGEWTVVERRAIRRGRVEKHVLARRASDDAAAEWHESVHLWPRAALRDALRDAGLRVTSEHGDLEGSAWTPDAPRLVLVAERA